MKHYHLRRKSLRQFILLIIAKYSKMITISSSFKKCLRHFFIVQTRCECRLKATGITRERGEVGKLGFLANQLLELCRQTNKEQTKSDVVFTTIFPK